MSHDGAYETKGVAGCAMGRSPALILLHVLGQVWLGLML